MHSGVNKINIYTELENADIITNYSEQNHNGGVVVVPSVTVPIASGTGIITINNISKLPIPFSKGHCVARGILLGQSQTEVPVIRDALPTGIKYKLEKVLQTYKQCFATNNVQLGNTEVEMKIELTSTQPIVYRPYRLSYEERKIVRQIIDDLLRNDIIEPTTSPYASPVLLVKKKTGDMRMCVDYRKLNAVTVKDKYPLPRMEDQLDRLSGSDCFTTLDLKSGYHQLKIAKDSRPLTAFITPDGHYQFKRVPFGLTNAPSVFQRAMNDILGNIRFTYALVYLDDVLIISKGHEEGLRRLENVLKIFRHAGLTLNRDKCSFLQSQVEYLGAIISDGVLRPSPRKVEAIINFPDLQNVHDVRRFLGLASYFRKFIPQFALKAKPLTKLTKANNVWEWNSEQQAAFKLLKQELSSEPLLALYDPGYETQLHTDASKIGLSGVLLQKQPDNSWKPVAYMSQQTTDCESRYHSYELETLAVVMSVRKFRTYLYGKHFTILTDCNAMRLTWTKRDLSPRVGRWWLELQEYDFDVQYRPGTQMKHVDALSRQPLPLQINSIKETDWLECVQAQDDDCVLLREQIENGEADSAYQLYDNKICKIINNKRKILIPKEVRWRIVKLYHDDNGHPGLNKTLEAIQTKYWFTNMKDFITKYVKYCVSCLCVKKPTGKRKGYLHPIPKIEKPFHTLHVDHVGPFCRTDRGNTYMFVTVDAFTKYTWIEAVPDTSVKHVTKCLINFIKFVGYPERIISDRVSVLRAARCNHFVKDKTLNTFLIQ